MLFFRLQRKRNYMITPRDQSLQYLREIIAGSSDTSYKAFSSGLITILQDYGSATDLPPQLLVNGLDTRISNDLHHTSPSPKIKSLSCYHDENDYKEDEDAYDFLCNNLHFSDTSRQHDRPGRFTHNDDIRDRGRFPRDAGRGGRGRGHGRGQGQDTWRNDRPPRNSNACEACDLLVHDAVDCRKFQNTLKILQYTFKVNKDLSAQFNKAMETHKGCRKSAFRLVSDFLDERDVTFEDFLAVSDEPALVSDGINTSSED